MIRRIRRREGGREGGGRTWLVVVGGGGGGRGGGAPLQHGSDVPVGGGKGGREGRKGRSVDGLVEGQRERREGGREGEREGGDVPSVLEGVGGTDGAAVGRPGDAPEERFLKEGGREGG